MMMVKFMYCQSRGYGDDDGEEKGQVTEAQTNYSGRDSGCGGDDSVGVRITGNWVRPQGFGYTVC